MTATYIALATITLASTDSEIVFSNIPNTYRDLVLVANYQGTGFLGDVFVRANGDAGTNYTIVWAYGDGTFGSGAGNRTGLVAAYTTDTGRNTAIWQIMDYSATNKQKAALTRQAGSQVTQMMAARWANTAAINSLSVRGDSNAFAIGSTFSLFGIN